MAVVLYTRYKALFKVRMTRKYWQAFAQSKAMQELVIMPVPFFILIWFQNHLGLQCPELL